MKGNAEQNSWMNNLNTAQKPWCFNLSRNFWFLAWSYFHDNTDNIWSRNAFAMVRKRRQNIFMGQDYGMPYCKESETKISLQSFYLLMQVRSHKITSKTVVRRKKNKKQKRYGRIHVKKLVKGIESNLDKFHFPPQILVSKVIFHPS